MAKTAEQEKAPEIAEYKTLFRVKHDKQTYKKGATLKLTATQAAPLLKNKSVEAK